MRIIQLIQRPQLRGAEHFACQLGNQLQTQGHEVFLVSIFSGDTQLPFNGLHISLNRKFTFRLFDIRGWYRLAKIIKCYKPDVVQANTADTLKYAVFSRLFFGWQGLLIYRNASMVSSYIKSPVVRLFNDFLFSRVDHIISVCQATCADFIRLFPNTRSKVTVLPVGLEIGKQQAVETIRGDRLLHIGGFTFEKNHSRLLHIFQRIQQHHPQLELWLAGDGPLKNAIYHEVAAMELDGVKFLGTRHDVVELMLTSKALLLPSMIEGLPAVILEAMYCRLPVVAYDVGGIGEVVKNNETGWLVEKGDEDAFVHAVLGVLNGDSVEKIIDNAHKMIVSKYDNLIIAKKFEHLYNNLINSNI
ncbi:MAG: glycosyltransferase [Chitinophagales bacterium]|nr:glycosyltransferase [Chitinophagales bacterium]